MNLHDEISIPSQRYVISVIACNTLSNTAVAS
jgi:glutamate racemase